MLNMNNLASHARLTLARIWPPTATTSTAATTDDGFVRAGGRWTSCRQPSSAAAVHTDVFRGSSFSDLQHLVTMAGPTRLLGEQLWRGGGGGQQQAEAVWRVRTLGRTTRADYSLSWSLAGI